MSEPEGPRVAWEEPDSTGPAPGAEYAPHGDRFLAYLVDCVIVIAIAAVLLIVIGVVFLEWATAASGGATVEISAGALFATFLLLLVVLLLILLYFPFFWARGGQTPGMWLFGLRVVRDRDGGGSGGAPRSCARWACTRPVRCSTLASSGSSSTSAVGVSTT